MARETFVRPRWLAPVAAFAGIALIVTACGDDDDDNGGASEPASVAIEATGGEGGVTYTAPDEVPAGATEIQFTNSSDLNEIDGQLVYTAEEHSDEEVAAELRNAFQGQPVADWFEGGGGVGSTAKGETDTVTQELREGTYYVMGGEDPPQPPLTKFTVTAEDDGAELPETEGTVTAQEYSFTGEGLKAGSNPVLLENAGGQWHHFLASRIAEGSTIEDVKRFLETEESQGPPPLAEGEQIETTVLEGGSSQVVDLELEPGRYAFFCFISDKQGGPPHVAQGMVSEVTVEE